MGQLDSTCAAPTMAPAAALLSIFFIIAAARSVDIDSNIFAASAPLMLFMMSAAAAGSSIARSLADSADEGLTPCSHAFGFR
jgi:hypothetical protein